MLYLVGYRCFPPKVVGRSEVDSVSVVLVSTPQWVAFAPSVGLFVALYGSFLTIFVVGLPPTVIG
uniref:Uncharacterized protein n=1 Tax=Fagus sylvatica TaxID=28930 RepID=A0A2N9HKE1_FAGSY